MLKSSEKYNKKIKYEYKIFLKGKNMHNTVFFFMIVETKESYTRYHIKYFDEVITYIYIPEIHQLIN